MEDSAISLHRGDMSVAELKAQGNASFAAKDYASAIQHYTSAIEAAKSTGEKDGVHVLYSNRSASYAGMKDWEAALKDAEETIPLIPRSQRVTDAREVRCTANECTMKPLQPTRRAWRHVQMTLV